jgi:hypothetical protein
VIDPLVPGRLVPELQSLGHLGASEARSAAVRITRCLERMFLPGARESEEHRFWVWGLRFSMHRTSAVLQQPQRYLGLKPKRSLRGELNPKRAKDRPLADPR